MRAPAGVGKRHARSVLQTATAALHAAPIPPNPTLQRQPNDAAAAAVREADTLMLYCEAARADDSEPPVVLQRHAAFYRPPQELPARCADAASSRCEQ